MTNAPPRLFDTHAQALYRARAARMAGDRFLLQEALEGVAARLAPVNRHFKAGIAVDGRAGGFLKDTAALWHVASFDDGERLDAGDGGYDLAVSVLSLHGMNDLPGALVQIRRALKPDGLFVAALFGGATLTELRDAFAAGELETLGGISPRVAPFADVRELGALLQRTGFALPVADVERTTVLYRDFGTLVRDLRLLGEGNALAERRRTLSRRTLHAALAHYAAKHAEPDGRLRATFDIVYLTGWVPHESQQQPLRPGSAKARMAEALGTIEHKAGDKAKPR
ncbi:MAG: methyltransferase domain-containing protein [Alphaproteobacteria bacterium]|nr:methyltransferase domain-containing protein [Alphaproteobacteria bacterium]